MKRKNIKIGIVALSIILAGLQLNSLDVFAGYSRVSVESESLVDSLDASWNNPDADLIVKEGKIYFPAESTQDTRLITAQRFTADEYFDEFLNLDLSMNLKQLPEGKRFVIALGLDYAESYYGEEESVEIFFENRGGIHVGAQAYDEEGQATVVAEAKRCTASLGKDTRVAIDINKDMSVKVAINGKVVQTFVSPNKVEGRVGFMQTGSCEVILDDIRVETQIYDRPENTNIYEDFESGKLDTNLFTSKMTHVIAYPAGLSIEKYNGNYVMMFRHSNVGDFGTVHDYSNFEMTFDMPYFQWEDVVNEDGLVTQRCTGAVILSFGGEPSGEQWFGHETAAESFIFSPNLLYTWKGRESLTIDSSKYCDIANNEGFSVKLTVLDKKVTLALKLLDSDEYEEMFSLEMDYTPLGKIQFWSSDTTFALDNLKITNLDNNPNLIELEKAYYVPEGTEDWEYQEAERVYVDATEPETGFKWPILLVYAVIAGEVVIVAAVIIRLVRKRKLGGDKNEEKKSLD